jgi:hypothetical protein
MNYPPHRHECRFETANCDSAAAASPKTYAAITAASRIERGDGGGVGG